MAKKFRALRIVSGLFKVCAWIALIGGILGAIAIVLVSAVQGRAGAPIPVMRDLPIAVDLSGIIPGLFAGAVFLIATLFQFLLLYAASESIHLGLAIEQNTRETAYYLRGEGSIPPPPTPVAWETPQQPAAK